MIKAVATDIDGTITNEKRQITVDVIYAFRKIEKKGIKVILVSGNVLPVTMGFKIFIGTTGPIISENGGMVLHDKIYKYFDKADIEKEYLRFKEKYPEAERIITDRWRETSITLIPSMDIKSAREFFVPLGYNVQATGFGIHIMHKEQNKLFGLKKVSEMLSIDLEEIMAFGDSENDLEMLKNVGIGVAVSNAWNVVKENADYVTKRNYGYGVIEALKKYKII
ncbi:MAG: phosphoglycolate phosphatase [Thermoplasmata archaeon]|jgi:phosphoglycolate phosphatase (TIGR01487 family)|nr:phosphoglycolate phosphatase [Euryarchaeota archaeon]MVT36246.1 phosphoglycolate phosphatase [Euryarchaeota archaeon]